jgi:hypothetical protein
VIYGGPGTAVGRLVVASLRAGMAVKILLVRETGTQGYSRMARHRN